MGCSTPFGDGAMWTKWPSCQIVISKVLNAFWRRGDVDYDLDADCARVTGVLNAFWRRGDVDFSASSPSSPNALCSTPFGDGAMWTAGGRTCGWQRRGAQRLLATGRCGLVSKKPSSTFSTRAQRLLATGRCGPPGIRKRRAIWRMCSTPFGDGAMWTMVVVWTIACLGCAQRLLATGRCGLRVCDH